MSSKEKKIIIAGFGGQGVVLAGNLIARACIFENKFVTGMVAYGAEMRGGTANATIIVSDCEIASPVVETADIAIILNQPSLDRYEDAMAKNGLVVLNSSLVKRELRRKDLSAARVDATQIAEELGTARVANIVALGAFIKATGLLKLASIEQAIDELFAEKKADMAAINRQALLKGFELCSCPGAAAGSTRRTSAKRVPIG
jgi:2-oxoglutarate ferredoxin oxidoreductase subunit gamma